MFSALAALFGKAALGGVTGILGNICTNVFSYFQKRQEHKQKMEERHQARLDRQQIHDQTIIEMEKEIEITKAEYEGKVEVVESEAFKESQKTQLQPLLKASTLDRLFAVDGWKSWIATPTALLISLMFGTVDFLKHLIRPGITVYVSIIYGFMIIKAYEILEASNHVWSQEQAEAIIVGFIDLTIYMVGMIWGWYFADRRISKNFKSIMGK